MLVTCALALTTGCDQRQLVGPATHATPTARHWITEDAPIGSATLTAPNNNAVAVGSVPDSAWVMVQVSGHITVQPNPDCAFQPPEHPCSQAAPWTPFATDVPNGSGPVAIRAGNGQVYLRGEDQSDANAVGLITPGEAESLMANLNLNNPTAPDFDGKPVTSYIFTGGYTVTATALRTPINITGTPTGAADGSVTYTAAAVPPLRFQNTYDLPSWWPQGAVEWYFVKGDSVPEHTTTYGNAALIGDCWHHTTCTWTPPAGQNGRMEVAAYVEGNLVIARSNYVYQQPSRCPLSAGAVRAACEPGEDAAIVLTCTGDLGVGRVTRGQSITCVVSPEPATDSVHLVVTRWSFDGAPREDEPLQGLDWSGPMAKGGTVTVSGHVGSGPEKSASAQIEVVARDWSQKLPHFDVHRVTTGDVHYALPAADAVQWTQDLGVTEFTPETESAAIVSRGPNFGYNYFSDLQLLVHEYWMINDEAFARNSAFVQAQEPNSGSATMGTRIGTGYCQQRDVPSQARKVERHELAHVEFYNQRFVEAIRPELNKLESLVSKDVDELDAASDDAIDSAHREAVRRSREVVDDVNGQYVTRWTDSSGHQCLLKNVYGDVLQNKPNATQF